MERQLLIDSLHSLSSCSEQTKIKFAEIFSIKTLSNGQSLSTGTKDCRSLYFIIKGLLQSYTNRPHPIPSTIPSQQKATLQFYLPGDTMINDNICKISALCPSTVLSTEYHQIQQFCSLDPSAINIMLHLHDRWNNKLMAQLHLLHLELGIYRYQQALDQLGPYFYQIPHQTLASYLSMSRKHLYRINKQNLKNK